MARTPSTMQPLGRSIHIFDLPDQDGQRVTNKNIDKRGTLVMFLSSHCPFVILLKAHLADLTRAYKDEISIYGIMSNDVEKYPDDGLGGMQQDRTTFGYTFPYLLDETQTVAKAFEAACTPDFFLYDGQGKLFYRGQYDGARPGNGVDVTGEDLRNALDTLLGGRPSPEPQQPSLGCNIKWREGNAPSYFGS